MKIAKFQPVLALKPTQFSVGLLEVEYKFLELKKMKDKKLRKLLKTTRIPVVISPWREICVTDHHHFLFACWHAGVSEVRVKVVKDFSRERLSYNQFWKKMARLKLAYLYDQFGTGPQEPLYLPMDVRGMADDPYRSLAWMARKEGGYENSTKTFAEFAWADLFRKKKLLHAVGRSGFQKALGQAVKLARSQTAKNLPGFISPKNTQTKIFPKKVSKSKFVPLARKKGAVITLPTLED